MRPDLAAKAGTRGLVGKTGTKSEDKDGRYEATEPSRRGIKPFSIVSERA